MFDKFEQVELVWRSTHSTESTGNVPTEHIRPANHPSEAVNQIAFGHKVKNRIHGSVSVQRERRPRASEKRRTLLPSQDIGKVSQKPSNSTFFSSLFEGKQGDHKVPGQDTYLFVLDDLIQSKTTGETWRHQRLVR